MCKMISFSLLFFLVAGSSLAQENCSDAARRDNELQFLFMASGGSAFNDISSVVGVQIALEKINANSSILTNYTLNYSSIVDSKVSPYAVSLD